MEENKQQQDNGNKVRRKFDESLKMVQAILGRPDWFKNPKVGKDELPELLHRLTSNKKEELFKKFEAAAISLIEKKLAFDKSVKQKEQEFNKAVEDKMKEFQVDMDAMFALIDQIQNITKDYFNALTTVADGTAPVVLGNSEPREGMDDSKP